MTSPLLVLALLSAPQAPPAAEWPRAAERVEMVREIADDFRRTRQEIGRQAPASAVLAALGRVPRHEFVPVARRREAYENRPLPIGHGQTISQPYIVALMTDLLDLSAGDRVLDVGTGSGYQAAILADLGARVQTIEIIPELAREAAERLRRLGYEEISTRAGDGYEGWPEAAPFDGIVVAAASSHIPPPLLRQLAPGGKMVIPVGDPFTTQYLVLVEKLEGGGIRTRQLLPVLFVPLTRDP